MLHDMESLECVEVAKFDHIAKWDLVKAGKRRGQGQVNRYC